MAPKHSIDHFIKFRLLSCCWNTKLTTTVQQIYSFIVSNNIVSFSWWFRKFCFEHLFNRWQFRSTRTSSSTFDIISIFHFSSHMFSTCVTWKYYDGGLLCLLINMCIQEEHNRIFWRLQKKSIDKTLSPILILKGHKLYTDSLCLVQRFLNWAWVKTALVPTMSPSISTPAVSTSGWDYHCYYYCYCYCYIYCYCYFNDVIMITFSGVQPDWSVYSGCDGQHPHLPCPCSI